MYYSSSLLKQFISVDDTTENIANNLILKTCEIEEIVERKLPDEVVIGYVNTVEKHPDADKLSVCQVDCGSHGQFQIVCGGNNVAADMFVATAIPGCYLPDIDLKIEKRTLRWLDSNGMICSKAELGINEDVDNHGIWILTEDFDDLSADDIGKSLISKHPRLNTRVMDVDNKWITHRPDLTWHFGIATELYAIYHNASGSDNKIKSDILSNYYQTFSHTNILESLESGDKSKKKIEAKTDLLRSYILLELENISVERSSFFTRLQLLDLWLEPRNNWVDFSNLFLFWYGQPVHFFDADKVHWNIIVRNAIKWEKFVDLFDVEHVLLENDIVVADQDKVLALAGIIWSSNSGVHNETKNIIVEIANFDPVAVRKTGTRLWLRTDAELRFEKNINPKFSLYSLLFLLDALKYYTKDLGKFEVWGLDYFVSEELKKDFMSPKLVDVDIKAMTDVIFGKEVEWFQTQAEKILLWLWFGIQWKKDAVWTLSVPLWRWPGDINIQEDLFEEVARIYGYDLIEALPMIWDVTHIPYSGLVQAQRVIENYLVRNASFDQVESYPRVDNKLLGLFSVDQQNLYHLQNPLNNDAPCLRNTMRENLVSYIARNSKFFDSLKIFDIWKVWDKQASKLLSETRQESFDKRYASNYVSEKTQLWWVIYKKSLSDRSEDTILEVKNILKGVLWEFELIDTITYKTTAYTNYHPKKQADIYYNDILIWFVGSLHPLINKWLKIPEHASVSYFSIYLESLETLLSQNKEAITYSFETLKDQIVWRDLCFVLDEKEDFAQILDGVKNIDLVSDIEVFDLYKGENLPTWKKSIAFRFKITWEGNMTTEEINKVMQDIIKKVESKGANLRA